MTPQLRTLNTIQENLWAMLEAGATDPESPLHTPVLGSIAVDGQTPRLRSVILRQVQPQTRCLICHSHKQAEKVAELRANPAMSWLFYDPTARIQLRLRGQASLHNQDALADEHWQIMPLSTRQLYLSTQPPGSTLPSAQSAMPPFLQNRLPTQAESEQGRPYFMLIRTEIDAIDWLYLDRSGNRRASFVWNSTRWAGQWLVP